MTVTYPTLMVSGSGDWEAITEGHGLSAETLAEVELKMIGTPQDGWKTVVEEVFFDYHPRIKWCERINGGWSCDMEGEWHGHWIEVLPSEHPSTHFTIIRHEEID